MAIVRPGQALNDLVVVLERALAGGDHAQVERNARRMDRDTGRLREHDVIITWRKRHHRIVSAIECRDRKRPVGVPDLEAFVGKCRRTGIDHMVVVSSTGFTRSAQLKAAAEGVTLMALSQVSEFDWCKMECWVEERREFIGFDATVYFVDDDAPLSSFALFDCNRTELTPDRLQATFVEACGESDFADREADVFVPVHLHVNTIDWIARDKTGREYPVSYIRADGGFTTRRWFRPVTLHSYSGENGAYGVASADLALGDKAGKIVMINDNAGTQVLWLPIS